MKPVEVFSKSLPKESRSGALIVTPVSRQILAGKFPSAKKRQPAASSSLLILILAVASFHEHEVSTYSLSTRTMASGSRSMTVNKTRAARSGTRRPCSQS